MRKGKSVIGKPILSLADGRRLDEVEDVLLDADNDRIAGLLVDEGGLFSSSMIVPTEEIVSFGRDAVVVRAAESILAASDAPAIAGIVDRKESLLGTKVFTETGEDQGKVGDVYFDESNGRVLGLEVSGGTMTDAARGVRYLPVEDVLRVGPDVLYVHPETAQTLEEQRGGIAGALRDAGDKAKEAAGKAGDAARGAASDAQSGVAGQVSDARPEDRLIGKRSGRDVEDDTGSVIVPAGRRITTDDVERARSADKLGALTTAVGVGEAGMAGEDAKDALGNAGDAAVGLWDSFTRKVGELTDATGRRMDEESTKRRLTSIQDAVGRPVTKVILDLEDRVVLDVGDIITHAAIQRAFDAGSLDSLLDSVYKAEVVFDKEELRAQRPGEANLEGASTPGVSAPIVEELRSQVDAADEARAQGSEEKKQQVEADRQRRETERDTRKQQRDRAAGKRKADGPAEDRTPQPVGPGREAIGAARGRDEAGG